jgi:hypothetical protein
MDAAPAPRSVAQLYRRCDPERLDFRTTDELADLAELGAALASANS